MSAVQRTDRLVRRRRLVCTQCYGLNVNSVLRCRGCGAIFPTSKLGPILISRGAFAFYIFILVAIAMFSFT